MSDSTFPDALPARKPGRFGNRPTPRAFVFASDPQYPWTPASDDDMEQSDSERDRQSQELINEQYASIASYRNSFGGTGIPVMINGDMTAFGHGWQREVLYPALQHHLKENYYFGLGNHDYKNNINDTLNDGAARDSIMDLINHHQNRVDIMHLETFRGADETRYSGSLSYSMSFGRVRLIQLNNEPTYRVSFNSGLHASRVRFFISDALDWLEQQLEESHEHGQITLLNLHQPDFWDGTREDHDRFSSMMRRYPVHAVFAGHYHKEAGDFYRGVGRYGGAPVYLSGSASQRTYLIAELSDDADALTIKCAWNNDWANAEVLATLELQ
ncbi:metallophosphoesterase family protein [Pseudomonas sp. NPDC089752]|uniref:metallophosphoesterase family protein n=1 Tax=Pseudomonas sp. NPDC089752 TaxID=3364472 RepID=UPI003830A225